MGTCDPSISSVRACLHAHTARYSITTSSSSRKHTHAANLVLQDTVERVYVGNRYGDIERGVYIVRGENFVLLGELVRVCE